MLNQPSFRGTSEEPVEVEFDIRAQIRREREDNIRRHSELYGRNWCVQNANKLGLALHTWKNDNTVALPIKVRAYSRENNQMRECNLGEILKVIKRTESGQPERLYPTAFGQVVLRPDLYISAAIYQLVCAILVSIGSFT